MRMVPLGVLSVIATPLSAASLSDFIRMQKLVAVLAACVLEDRLTTYRPVAQASDWGDWGHRDRKFHVALGEISSACIKGGWGAITAVVTRSEDGQPTMPGNEFFTLIENDRGIAIPRDAQGNLVHAEMMRVWNSELRLLGMKLR